MLCLLRHLCHLCIWSCLYTFLHQSITLCEIRIWRKNHLVVASLRGSLPSIKIWPWTFWDFDASINNTCRILCMHNDQTWHANEQEKTAHHCQLSSPRILDCMNVQLRVKYVQTLGCVCVCTLGVYVHLLDRKTLWVCVCVCVYEHMHVCTYDWLVKKLACVCLCVHACTLMHAC